MTMLFTISGGDGELTELIFLTIGLIVIVGGILCYAAWGIYKTPHSLQRGFQVIVDPTNEKLE